MIKGAGGIACAFVFCRDGPAKRLKDMSPVNER